MDSGTEASTLLSAPVDARPADDGADLREQAGPSRRLPGSTPALIFTACAATMLVVKASQQWARPLTYAESEDARINRISAAVGVASADDASADDASGSLTYSPTPTDATHAPSHQFNPSGSPSPAPSPLSPQPTISFAPSTPVPTSFEDELKDFLPLLDELKDEAAYCVMGSALCSDATCTLNADKQTASCGCLKMPATTGNPAELAISWSSFPLAASSSTFREVVRECVDAGGCSQKNKDKLCDHAKSGDLWSDLKGKVSSDYPISLWSANPMTTGHGNITNEGNIFCENAVCTQCMSAPCYENHYDSVYDLTCICAVTSFGGKCKFGLDESKSDGGLCDEIDADRASCAACSGGISGGGYEEKKTASETIDYVAAMLTADPAADASQCPSYGGLAPVKEGRADVAYSYIYGNNTDDRDFSNPSEAESAEPADPGNVDP